MPFDKLTEDERKSYVRAYASIPSQWEKVFGRARAVKLAEKLLLENPELVMKGLPPPERVAAMRYLPLPRLNGPPPIADNLYGDGHWTLRPDGTYVYVAHHNEPLLEAAVHTVVDPGPINCVTPPPSA